MITSTKKPVICFIDDDENELTRFAAAMANRFDVITATTFPDCQRQLQQRNLAKPDLWVLDLYFPERVDIVNTPDQLNTMNSKYFRLHQAVAEFRAFLQGIGQGVAGGLELIRNCKAAGGPVVMFTRKGMLDDAILCIDNGASAVLKKPMPSSWPENDEPEAVREALDDAMMENSARLIEHFERHIRPATRDVGRRAACWYWWGVASGVMMSACLGCVYLFVTQ